MNFACRLYVKWISCNCWPSKSKVIKCKFVPLPMWKDTLNATYIFFIPKYSSKFHTTKADSFSRCCQCAFKSNTVKSIGADRLKLSCFLKNSIVIIFWKELFFSFSKILKRILLVHFQLSFLPFLSYSTIINRQCG